MSNRWTVKEMMDRRQVKRMKMSTLKKVRRMRHPVVTTIPEVTAIATSPHTLPMLVTGEMEVVTIRLEGICVHFLHHSQPGIHPMYMDHPPTDKKLQPQKLR